MANAPGTTSFDVDGARHAGYSDSEIADHLANDAHWDAGAARHAGYSDGEIIAHLTQAEPLIAKPPPQTKPEGADLGAAQPAPQAQPQKRSLSDDVTGFMATVNSHIPFADEMAAAARTGGHLMTGGIGLSDVPQDFSSSMGRQRALEAGFQGEHPHLAALARGTGDATTVAAPVPKLLAPMTGGSRVGNMARGAVLASTTAAANAAADRGTPGERLQAASEAALNPIVLAGGAVGGALAPAARAKPSMTQRQTDAATLGDIGVTTSIPQRMGAMAKQTEDLAMRAPILGPAISGARSRQVEQLNRGVALKALEPVGETIPASVKPGFDMVEHVDEALGRVYDKAARMVPRVSLDDAFIKDAETIGARRADLSESEARQWDSIVKDRITRLQSGTASGEMVKQIHGELGGLQAEQARKGNATLSGMIGDLRRSMLGIIERANPEAGDLIRKADQGWQVYSIMNDAAAQASNRGGVYLPGQLNTQVRSAGKRLGSNMTGKGKAPLQDIATAATRMIPDQFGNPGTANAVGLGGMGVGLMTSPAQTVSAAAGLTAAATPYWMMGRKVIESLPANATSAELRAAQIELDALAAKDPAVDALRRQVAARLSSGAGVEGRPHGAVTVQIEGRPEYGVGASSR